MGSKRMTSSDKRSTPGPWEVSRRTEGRTIRAAIEDKISCDDFPYAIFMLNWIEQRCTNVLNQVQ